MSKLIGEPSYIQRPEIKEEECVDSELFEYLRAIPQYQNSNFTLEAVNLDDRLYGVQTSLKEFKYIQMDWMCGSDCVPMLKPRWLRLTCGISALVLPPIAERSDDRLIVIEGHDRPCNACAVA